MDGLLISKRIVNFEDAIVRKIMDRFKCRVDYKHECRLEIPIDGEGYDICDYVEETFPQLNACISTNKGAVVIHRKEYDKSQILSEYDNLIYVTDTIDKYSYDYHISQKLKQSTYFHQTNYPPLQYKYFKEDFSMNNMFSYFMV